MMEHALVLIIIFPLLGAFLTHLTKYTRMTRGAELVSVLSLSGSIGMLLTFFNRSATYDLGGWAPPLGISLSIDALSFFFAFFILLGGMFIVLYSVGMYQYARRYYSLLLIALAAMLGIVLTRDIFNMYVFFEILAAASYVLITYRRQEKAFSASFNYLIMTEAAWVFFLLAIAILYGMTGTLNMDIIATRMGEIYASDPRSVYAVFSMMLVAFGIKCGMFPLHAWVPEAYSRAPSSVSALLSGLVVKAGLYSMIRVFFLFFVPGMIMPAATQFLFYLGIATLIAGGCLALVQDELKKVLAYSSINQVGFVLLALGLGTEAGLVGGIFHILNHVLIKMGLFFCAGIIISQTGFFRISNMKGIWKKMPGVTASFCALSLALIGIPPFNGFISKLLMVLAAVREQNTAALFFFLAGIVLTAAYCFRMIQLFFSPEDFKQKPDFKPQPLGPFEHFTMYAAAALCLLIGLFPGTVMFFVSPAVKVLLR